MVEIIYLKNREDGNPDFPQSVWDKKRAVALLDFEQFEAKKNIDIFRGTQERGAFTCAYEKSYNHFLDTLDNKAIEKDRWQRECGTLYILKDIVNEDNQPLEKL